MDTVKYGVHTVSAPYPHGVGTGQAPDKVLGKSLGEDPMRGRILVRMAKSMEDIIGDRARAEGITRGAWARRHLARAVGQPQSSRSRQRLPGPDRETKMLGDVEQRITAITLVLREAARRMDVDGHLPDADGKWSARSFRSTLQDHVLPTLEVVETAVLALLELRRP